MFNRTVACILEIENNLFNYKWSFEVIPMHNQSPIDNAPIFTNMLAVQ